MYRLMILILFLWINMYSTHAQEGCNPQVNDVRFDGEYDPEVSLRIYELYQADQAMREPNLDSDIEQLIADDLARREEIIVYLQNGLITRASDLYYSALIFQHGNCSEHYQLASNLALQAYELGYTNAGWLYTASTDRYLLSVGQVQRYGTQYTTNIQGNFVLCPVNLETTDTNRAEFGLPTLAELQERSVSFNELFETEPHQWANFHDIPFLGQILDTVIVLGQCFSF
ncbi:MAG: hypothetical protein Phog2KO_45050 [Phototrophicaceae bacterium]